MSAAADTASAASLAGFHEFVTLLKSHLASIGTEAFLWQIAAIVAAAALGLAVSLWLSRRAAVWSLHVGERHSPVVTRLLRFGMQICDGVAFSLVAALTLSLLVQVLQFEAFLSTHGNLLLAKMAYSVFYAWAVIVVCLELLSGMLGGKISAGVLRGIKILFWVLAILQIVGILPEAVKILRSVTLPVGNGNVTLWAGLVSSRWCWLLSSPIGLPTSRNPDS